MEARSKQNRDKAKELLEHKPSRYNLGTKGVLNVMPRIAGTDYFAGYKSPATGNQLHPIDYMRAHIDITSSPSAVVLRDIRNTFNFPIGVFMLTSENGKDYEFLHGDCECHGYSPIGPLFSADFNAHALIPPGQTSEIRIELKTRLKDKIAAWLLDVMREIAGVSRAATMDELINKLSPSFTAFCSIADVQQLASSGSAEPGSTSKSGFAPAQARGREVVPLSGKFAPRWHSESDVGDKNALPTLFISLFALSSELDDYQRLQTLALLFPKEFEVPRCGIEKLDPEQVKEHNTTGYAAIRDKYKVSARVENGKAVLAMNNDGVQVLLGSIKDLAHQADRRTVDLGFFLATDCGPVCTGTDLDTYRAKNPDIKAVGVITFYADYIIESDQDESKE